MLEAVWQSTVIVKVTVYPQVHDAHATPFYCTAKRIHYPSSLLPKLARFYSALGDDTVSQMVVDNRVWFEATGFPVRWNQPIGLLCDITKTDDDWLDLKLVMSSTAVLSPSSPTLQQQHKVDPQDATRHAFFNSLKEAEAMRRTKQRRVMQLTRHEQQSLWDAVQSEHGNYHSFKQIVDGKLLAVEPKMAAVKVYDCRECEVAVRSAPVQLYKEMTVGELVGVIIGDFDMNMNRIVTHGIRVDVKTPVLELLEFLAFPDTMVHLALL